MEYKVAEYSLDSYSIPDDLETRGCSGAHFLLQSQVNRKLRLPSVQMKAVEYKYVINDKFECGSDI